ncbi:MAG: hypothetical protein JO130_14490, partial [Solirubrobacterales bacterium]|nr:hypothetical protein [Solirubrobacterales bacterium]
MDEIIAVMHAAGDDAEGVRLRGLIVVLWRAGLRVSEALALAKKDSSAADGTDESVATVSMVGGRGRADGLRWHRSGFEVPRVQLTLDARLRSVIGDRWLFSVGR